MKTIHAQDISTINTCRAPSVPIHSHTRHPATVPPHPTTEPEVRCEKAVVAGHDVSLHVDHAFLETACVD